MNHREFAVCMHGGNSISKVGNTQTARIGVANKNRIKLLSKFLIIGFSVSLLLFSTTS